MTPEELERAMNSITKQHEITARYIAAMTQRQSEHETRVTQSQTELAQGQGEHEARLAQIQVESAQRQVEYDARLARSQAEYEAQLAQRQAEHEARLAQIQIESAQGQVKHEERLDEHNERIARFERSYTEIAELLANHDGQIVTLTNNANKTNEVVANLAQSTIELNATVTRLTATVEQYIKARGNGSNGTSGT